MQQEKIRLLAYMLFKNQSEMAKELNISKSKIGKVIQGDQQLSIDSLGILIMKYNIDARWLFADDNDLEIKYQESAENLKEGQTYREKYLAAIEELAEYRKKKIDDLKNIENVPDQK